MKFKGKVKILESFELLPVLAKGLKKPVMFVSIYVPKVRTNQRFDQYYKEVVKAAPYLDLEQDAVFISEEGGFIVFDKQDDMEKAFWATVGDDGPTKTNKYNGPVKVYAATCSAHGELLNENT